MRKTTTRGAGARRVLLSLTIAAATALISACDDGGNAQTYTPQGQPDQSAVIGLVRPHYVDLPDGRQVLCVYEEANNSSGGGPSCDWQNARPNLAPKPAPAERKKQNCPEFPAVIFGCNGDEKWRK